MTGGKGSRECRFDVPCCFGENFETVYYFNRKEYHTNDPFADSSQYRIVRLDDDVAGRSAAGECRAGCPWFYESGADRKAGVILGC